MNCTDVLIFSGFNQRAVIALCRTLTQRGVPFHIIALSEEDGIFLTEYRLHVRAVRSKKELNWEDTASCLQQANPENRSMLVAPSSEALNRFLLTHRESLRELNCTLPLVDEELYTRISDKLSFASLCKTRGIPVPEEIDGDGPPALPVVAKPRKGVTNDGRSLYPILIHREDQWQAFIEHSDRDLYFLQRFVDGESFYLLYYISRSGEVAAGSQRNLVQQPGGKSIVAAELADLHQSELSKSYETLLHELGFHGLVMIEVIRQGDDFFMIEANPRMWGPSQLLLDSGSLLFEFMLQDYGVIHEVPNAAPVQAVYFWWDGFWEPLLKREPLRWHCRPEYFWDKYPLFVSSDIYARSDTKEYFSSRAKKLTYVERAEEHE